ncbi:branched-chain amino acid ABC transporter permease [Aestuariispira insulae]|uniref:Amino acid/amide ABC transporter membrane protein 2 (HAAT family) n=1 Tax=Aestuariispira insulae TaxID=1461337 RepID=A0A3D9HI15_9PROT|nr:branched-chain amino acid ABC transporter permease [Aestuariispira insulae]RED49065.1 amino acid/amide ABC transporter membrane protein 2 (HAAT family) [Aestuariispira insulae]
MTDTLNRETIVNISLAFLLLAAPMLALALDEPFYISLATKVAILSLAGVGLNLALGYGGMISFGHAAFFGVGGYVAGISAHHMFEGSDFLGLFAATDQLLLIWPMAIILCGGLAILIGLFSLRTTGVYFIMITLAFAQMIYYLGISIPTYGGEDGLPIYVRNQLPVVSSDDPLTFFLVCYALLMGGIFLSSRIIGSRFGAALQTARMNEVRLATVGIAPFPVKLTGFVLSAMITGLAGALFAELNGFVGPSMLSWHRSGEIMIFVILGGVGRLYGPLAGAALFILLEFFIGGFTDRWQFFLGLILLGVVLFAKGGLMGLIAGRARHD